MHLLVAFPKAFFHGVSLFQSSSAGWTQLPFPKLLFHGKGAFPKALQHQVDPVAFSKAKLDFLQQVQVCLHSFSQIPEDHFGWCIAVLGPLGANCMCHDPIGMALLDDLIAIIKDCMSTQPAAPVSFSSWAHPCPAGVGRVVASFSTASCLTLVFT